MSGAFIALVVNAYYICGGLIKLAVLSFQGMMAIMSLILF
jgi:hypothetical protein